MVPLANGNYIIFFTTHKRISKGKIKTLWSVDFDVKDAWKHSSNPHCVHWNTMNFIEIHIFFSLSFFLKGMQCNVPVLLMGLRSWGCGRLNKNDADAQQFHFRFFIFAAGEWSVLLFIRSFFVSTTLSFEWFGCFLFFILFCFMWWFVMCWHNRVVWVRRWNLV